MAQERRPLRRRGRLVAGAMALALLAAACGDDDDGGTATTEDSTDDTSGSDTTDTTAGDDASELLGEPNPASGDPVVIGLISSSESDSPLSAQFQRVEQGMNMAADYANEHLAGIAGRPIELFICQGAETPSGSQDCANQMVNEGVTAVVSPFSGNGAVIVPVLTAGGIPYITLSAASREELTTPGVFALTGGYPATLAAFAAHARDNDVEKLAMLGTDVPAVVDAAQALGGIVFGNAEVDYEFIPVPTGTADMTPQLQAAVSGGATAIAMTGDLTFCASFLQAYQTLGLDQTRYLIATCIDPTNIEAYSSVLEGSIMTGTSSTDVESEDAQLYGAIVETYGDSDIDPDPTISTGQAAGLIPLLSFLNLMEGFTGEVTPATVMEQVRAAVDVPLFLGSGATFTCDGTAISILPNVCSGDVQIGTLNAEGKLQDTELVDTAPLFAT